MIRDVKFRNFREEGRELFGGGGEEFIGLVVKSVLMESYRGL